MEELNDCSWAEELNDFFWEIYQQDLAREAEAIGMAAGLAKGIAEGKAEGMAEGKAEGFAEGFAEGMAKGMAKGMNMVINSYIATNPHCSIEDAAVQLGVEEQLVRSLYPGLILKKPAQKDREN